MQNERKVIMEENKAKSFLLVCEDCENKFLATGNIVHKKEFKIEGKSIFLTYYDCPKCGRRHFVQVDDVNSLEQLKLVTSDFFKLAVMKRRDEKISKKQLAKFKKARQHLSDYRISLMKEYTNKSIHDDETDSDFVLRFSV